MRVARQDMGDARGGSSAGSVRNVVRYDINMETAGSRCTVVSVAADIRSVYR